MAVDFKNTEHKRTSEYSIFPQDIIVRPELNGRADAPDITDLIESIKLQGQLQPVLVRNDGGKAVLVAGFSRWRAISEINKKRKPEERLRVRCCYFRGNEAEAAIANIHENRARNTNTPMDDAHNMVRLDRYGKSHEEIAAIYGADIPFVRRRMELAGLTDEARAAVKDGRLTGSAAQAIAKLTAEQQLETLAKSNGKVKGSTIREVAASGSTKPKRAGLADVKEILRAAIEDGIYPVAFGTTTAPADAVDAFAGHILALIIGKPLERQEGA